MKLLINAILARASKTQFGPGQRVQFPCVKSRMMVWCVEGTGSITVNRVKYVVNQRDFLFLPWAHKIAYVSAIEHPMHLGGLHFVPNHKPDTPIIHDVDHSQSSWDSSADAYRKDVALPGFENTVAGRLENYPSLEELANAAVNLYAAGPPPEWIARYFGQIILWRILNKIALPQKMVSRPTQAVLDFIENHFEHNIGIEEMAQAAGLSRSTLNRYFLKEVGVAPARWLRQRRMEQASVLLKTSQMRIEEVAMICGFGNLYHFSGQFKKHHGLSPRNYRKKNRDLRV